MTKTRSLEKSWADFWVRGSRMQKSCILRKSWLQNHQKPFSKTRFWSIQKSWSKYLIKPVASWSFWSFSPNGTKIPYKPVEFQEFARLWETSKKHWLNNVLEHPKKLFNIPYKTCRLLMLFGPFSQKDTKTYQKRIRFPLKVSDVSRRS